MRDNALTTNKQPYDDLEAESEASAVVPLSSAPRPLANATIREPFAADVLEWAFDRRVDEMLARLNALDFLGALVLSECILVEAPEHGLSAVCRAEAMTVLQSLLGKPPVIDAEAAAFSEEAKAIVSRADGVTSLHRLLPASGIARVHALLTLHELVRLQLVQREGATKLERANTMPAPRR